MELKAMRKTIYMEATTSIFVGEERHTISIARTGMSDNDL
jgi:hypothetical protein